MQLEPMGHGACPAPPHACAPPVQICVLQSEGNVGLPMQSSQCSQVLRHAWTCVHGLHFVGSFTSAIVHEPPPPLSEPSQTVVGAPGIAQQPKQSHPFGVSGPQYDPHVADCVWNAFAQLPLYPGMFAFGL